MEVDLSINNDYLFNDYSEDCIFGRINFKGYLRDRFVGWSNKDIICFISGGLSDIDYKLIRDDAYIRGYIKLKSSES